MKGIEVAAEPEEVKVPYARPHHIQLTTIEGSANRELITVSAKTLASSMVLCVIVLVHLYLHSL